MKSLANESVLVSRAALAYRSTRMATACMAAMMTLAQVGCGKSDRLAVYPVEGRVVHNGKPLADALVVLYSHSELAKPHIAPRAQTDSEGRFQLSTYAQGDGAPAGDYAVTVLHYPIQVARGGIVAAGPNDLPKKYASPKTTDLRVQIAQGSNSLPLAVASPQDKKQARKRVAYN